jgi:hypothetical protein
MNGLFKVFFVGEAMNRNKFREETAIELTQNG